jgi:methylthioribulose-1-phosphate dehydratase
MASLRTQLVEALIGHTAELARAGLTPATSSNFSARLNAEQCVITVSGRDKGKLTPDDFMDVDMHGQALQAGQRSSAETLLHTQIYRLRPNAGAVLHTHSLAQTLLSMQHERAGFVEFKGYELLKAFDGIKSHDTSIRLPIVANSQDMPALCESVAPYFEHGEFWGYLIAGHGLYTWGRDLAEARRHLDAFEFLLNAELTKLRIST